METGGDGILGMASLQTLTSSPPAAKHLEKREPAMHITNAAMIAKITTVLSIIPMGTRFFQNMIGNVTSGGHSKFNCITPDYVVVCQ